MNHTSNQALEMRWTLETGPDGRTRPVARWVSPAAVTQAPAAVAHAA